MVAKAALKALARPGGPASMLPNLESMAAHGIKKVAKRGARAVRALARSGAVQHVVKKAVSHAAKSGALVHAGNSVAKGNMLRGIQQMRMPMGPLPMTKRSAGGKIPMMRR